MAHLNWEQRRREDRVKLHGAEPAHSEGREVDLSTAYLHVGRREQKIHARAARALLERKLTTDDDRLKWLSQCEEFKKCFPKWVEDEELKRLRANVDALESTVRRDLNDNDTRRRLHKLHCRLSDLEKVIKSRAPDDAPEIIIECALLLDAVGHALPQDKRLRLKVRFRAASSHGYEQRLQYLLARGPAATCDLETRRAARRWFNAVIAAMPDVQNTDLFARFTSNFGLKRSFHI